jgi:Tol biopolymer transport system component
LRSLALSIIVLVLALLADVSHAKTPPDIDWRTLETTHFTIYFNARNEETARRLAAMVEPIRQALMQELRWSTEEKTHVLLIDYLDVTNGSATPLPYNTIEIYFSPPQPNSALGDFDDWLRLVFTHEYVHTLHIDQSMGPSKITRDLLGRAAIATVGILPVPFLPFPNLLLPRWMVEGYATLHETRHTTAGRGGSTYIDMVMRMASLDNEFFPLDKGSGEEGEWPGGAFRYLYGEKFLEYMTEKHGIEQVNKMFLYNAYGLTPFLIDIPSYLATDQLIETEWENWRKQVAQDAQTAAKRISEEGATVPAYLTDSGWETRFPRISPDRKKAYFTVSNNYTYPHVSQIDLATGKVEELFERNSQLGPAAPDASGRYLYFAQYEAYNKFYLVGDAYRYDLVEDQVERLTRGERIVALDVSPDGERVVAVQNLLPGQRLSLFRVEGDQLVREKILAGDERRSFGLPRFSPQGDRVVVESWLPGGFVDIFVYDLQGNEQRLTSDRYLDVAPAFSHDGSRVYFSSDRTGIYNRFSVSASASTEPEFMQHTNVVGGIFESDFLDEQTLLSASYGGEGFNIARVRLNHAESAPAGWEADRPAFMADYPATVTAPAHAYSPGETLWPRTWRPLLSISATPGGEPLTLETGLAIGGADVLRKHAYALEAFYNRKMRRPGFVATYSYDGWVPTVTASLESISSEGALFINRPGSSTDLPGIRSDTAAVAISYPWPRVRFSQYVDMLYAYENEQEFGDLQHTGPAARRDRGLGLLRYRYDSSKYFGIGIGPQDGTLFSLTGRVEAPAFGGDVNNVLGFADARRYWTLPHRQVFTLQAQGGLAQASQFYGPFVLGGTFPRVSIADVGTLPLRGIPDSYQEGYRIAKGSAEYRFPLGLIKRGVPFWGTFPFLADQLHGALFTDAGSAWRDETPDWLASVGGEVVLDVTFGYVIPVSVGVGVAVPVYGAPGLGPTYYLTLSQVNY